MFSILKGHEGYHFNQVMGNWDFIGANDWVFAKVFRLNNDNKHSAAPAMLPSKFNLVEEANPDNLEEAFTLINKLAANPSLVAIRAQKTVTIEPFKRNRKNFNSAVPSKIVALDVDSVPLPASLAMDNLNIEKWAEYIIDCFVQISPDVFSEDMGFIAHASSSAGLKKGVRMHMLFEANIPVTQSQLKYFFSEVNIKAKTMFQFEIADLNYYSATQPHFFADPIFNDGIVDPFKGRSRIVYREGDTAIFPNHLPEFVSRKADVVKDDFILFDMIDGKRSFPKEVQGTIDELINAEDGVFLRIMPKLYHKAWQNGVNIKWLEKQITPIIEQYIYYADRRDRSVQDYLDNGRAEALRAFLGEARRLIPSMIDGVRVTYLDTTSEEDEVFLKMRTLPPKGSVTFVKASLGTGKTTAVVNWLKTGMVKGNFLAITNTRSLVSSNAEKFGAGQYSKTMDMLDFMSGTQTRMSTTIHSLQKFAPTADKINFLFIDECDAVMNDLLFSPILKKRKECIDTLHEIMSKADYIILSDGDISEETISAYGSLIDYNKPITAIDHRCKMLAESDAYEFCDEKSIWSAFKSCLELGEKCILVSDCSPDDLNEKAMVLRQQTGAVIKEVHSSSTEDEDIRRILDYTNEELKHQKIDGLLCSPSVTSGVDFRYFDNVFVLTLSNNHTPNLRFQALRRDRGAQSIFYYTDPGTRGFQAGSDQYNIDEDWIDKAQHLYAKRREIESMHFQNTFRYYLMEQGCKIKIIEESWGDLGDTKDAELSYKEQRINAVLESTLTYSPPRHNEAYQVKLAIIRYYQLDSTTDVDEIVINRYLEEKPDKAAEFFHKLYKNFWKHIKLCTNGFQPFIDSLKNHKRDFYLDTGCNANARFFKIYLKKAGIIEPSEFTNIINWYRIFCIDNNIDIPTEFLTEEESALKMQSVLELV